MAIEWHNVSNSRAFRRIGLEGGEASSGLTELPEGEYRIHVQFRRGKTYVYRVSSRSYFDQMLAANSRGRYYVYVLKARYDFIQRY